MNTPPITQHQAVKQLKAIETLVKSNPKAAEDFARLSGLVERIFNPKAPSYALSLNQTRVTAYLQFLRLLPEASVPQFEFLLGGLKGVLQQKGYLQSSLILTTQEHELIGSSEEDKQNVYVPIGILRGEFKLDDAKKARNLTLYFSPLALYYTLDGNISVTALLEPLGPDGKTKQDPRLIHPSYPPDKYDKLVEFGGQLALGGLPHQKSGDYPYPRP